jgi:hypothetical protein
VFESDTDSLEEKEDTKSVPNGIDHIKGQRKDKQNDLVFDRFSLNTYGSLLDVTY